MRQQAGFTLVEISIVLVIVGLLLGGLLQGHQLIESARVRAVINDINGISSAWFAFQDRYGAIPGDFANAQNQINASLVNGDGNGAIDSNQERGQVWAHLSAAGLLTGAYDGTANANNYNCPPGRCPNNGRGGAYLLSFAQESIGNDLAGTTDANELWSGNQLSASLLAEVDRKIDDGDATTGRMRLADGAVGWTAAASTACLNGTAYNESGDAGNCAAVFRLFD